MGIKKLKKQNNPDSQYDEQIKNNEMGGTCSTHGKGKNTKNLKERNTEWNPNNGPSFAE
jgi:Tfp pilus assembly protein PilF